MIIIPKKVAVEGRYKEFLRLIGASTATGLADREIDILDAFFWVSGGQIVKESRKHVAELLKITKYNLNNVIRDLRRKGLIVVPAGKEIEQIKPSLLCDLEADKSELVISFKLIS